MPASPVLDKIGGRFLSAAFRFSPAFSATPPSLGEVSLQAQVNQLLRGGFALVCRIDVFCALIASGPKKGLVVGRLGQNAQLTKTAPCYITRFANPMFWNRVSGPRRLRIFYEWQAETKDFCRRLRILDTSRPRRFTRTQPFIRLISRHPQAVHSMFDHGAPACLQARERMIPVSAWKRAGSSAFGGRDGMKIPIGFGEAGRERA